MEVRMRIFLKRGVGVRFFFFIGPHSVLQGEKSVGRSGSSDYFFLKKNFKSLPSFCMLSSARLYSLLQRLKTITLVCVKCHLSCFRVLAFERYPAQTFSPVVFLLATGGKKTTTPNLVAQPVTSKSLWLALCPLFSETSKVTSISAEEKCCVFF